MFKRKVVIVLLVVLLALSSLTFAVGLGTHSGVVHADDPTPTATSVGGGGITPDGPDCPSQDCPGSG